MYINLFKKALIVCLCFGFFACKNEKTTPNETSVNTSTETPAENAILFSEFPETSNITFKTLFNFKEGLPSTLHIIDSTLVIHSRGSSNLNFYNYSLNSGDLSEGYISKGRGPNEILSSYSSGFTNNHFWIHDIALKKIVMIDKADVLPKPKDSMGFKEYKFKEHTAIRVALKDSLTYYGVENLASEYKVSKMDLNLDTVIENFGKFKELPETIPLDVIKQAYSPLIALKPSGEKLMLAYRHTDLVEIYNLNTKKSIAIQGPGNFKPEFEVGENKNGGYMKFTEKTKIAFVKAATTKDYIYLLYSGRTEKDSPETFFGLANRICIYNWDAKPVKEITLNKEVLHIAVSNDNKKIYSFDVQTGDVLEADIDM